MLLVSPVPTEVVNPDLRVRNVDATNSNVRIRQPEALLSKVMRMKKSRLISKFQFFYFQQLIVMAVAAFAIKGKLYICSIVLNTL